MNEKPIIDVLNDPDFQGGLRPADFERKRIAIRDSKYVRSTPIAEFPNNELLPQYRQALEEQGK